MIFFIENLVVIVKNRTFVIVITKVRCSMYTTKMKERVVGVDIGLELTTYAIVDLRGNIIARDHFPTDEYATISSFVSKLAESIMFLAETNGGYETIRSVGISCPSANFKTGCMENAPNMPWKGVIPLAALLRDRLGLAVAVGNDCHVMGLGEHAFGCAHGMKDFIMLGLGHGVGSCVFTRNKAHFGANGFAGEIGHTCVVDNGRQCTCGLKGCLEAYVSTRGIVMTAKEVLEESDKPSLMRDVEKLSPKIITEFCDQGDELAIEVYRRTGYVLGISMATVASQLDPEAIILAGGIHHAGKWLIDPAQASFDQHVFHNIRGKVKLLITTLDDRERDLLGASALAWEVEEYSLFK